MTICTLHHVREEGYQGMKQYSGTAETAMLTRLNEAAKGTSTITFVGSAAGGEKEQSVTWNQLHSEARAAAAVLQKKGIGPGDNVALLGLTSRPLITAIQGTWLAGGCVNMLPIPMRMSSMVEFINQTRTQVAYADIKMLLIDPSLASFYEPQEGDPAVLLLDELMSEAFPCSNTDYRPVEEDPERLAILQFTSGSTSVPKGVMLPMRAICANIDAMDEVVNLSQDDDVLVSWLPLYHDMGLIGILATSMIKGCNLILAAPQDFLSSPGDWMRWMSNYKGTITAGPNFSYVLATRALRRMSDSGEELDLSKVRMALNGAEPIDPDSMDKFIAAAEKHGFRPGAEFTAFGMAEVTIAGTFPPIMRGMACDHVDREALEAEKIARPTEPGQSQARRLPLLGSPVPGLEMRICDPATGKILQDREVGELQIRGSSMTSGYYKQPQLTAELFLDGWLRTGDLGYFTPGPENGPAELVICGRLKDIIIVAGRNIYPEDIERVTAEIKGVRAGNVIAFGTGSAKGKEAVVVVAEINPSEQEDPEQIHKNIRYRALNTCGITPKDIVLVQKGTLPKTSSGKLQRSLCKRQYKENQLERI